MTGQSRKASPVSSPLPQNYSCANNGVDLNAESTPEYFIALTEHSFGGGTIAKLKKYYTEVK